MSERMNIDDGWYDQQNQEDYENDKAAQRYKKYDHGRLQRIFEKQFSLFNMEEFSDCKVVVKETTFYVSKHFLCSHSTVFRSYFTNNSIEKETSTIRLDDLNAKVVEAMLKFTYCGYLVDAKELDISEPELEELIYDLYLLADRYVIEELMNACRYYIVNLLTPQTIVKCLQLAYTLHDQSFKAMCLDYASVVYKQIRDNEDWIELNKSNNSVTLDVLNYVSENLEHCMKNDANYIHFKKLYKEANNEKNVVVDLNHTYYSDEARIILGDI